ncbi:MAG: hypothetical protein KAS69_02360 [Planctomycetes bacterium]|nr:hypothetical protein [Planctomycetota bacterium]
MRTTLIATIILGLSILAGCNAVGNSAANKNLLTVDFQKDNVLKYKFTSQKDITMDWGKVSKGKKQGKNKIDKSSETMEMLISYTPTDVNPYGLTTIEAKCESIKVKRSKSKARRSSGKDAVETAAGETFTFKIGPTGKIEDYSQLNKLIHKLGKNAFTKRANRGRVKQPDMIADFIASQWFLWDAVSSIENFDGISIGQSWKSKLSAPTPMVMKTARDVTYTLKEIRQTEKGQIAVITSSYSLADSAPQNWPMPYSGKFRMSGMFGFLRGYKALSLQGKGEELFNIDSGQIEKYNQNYQLQIEAVFPMALGENPKIIIDQTLTMQLIK